MFEKICNAIKILCGEAVKHEDDWIGKRIAAREFFTDEDLIYAADFRCPCGAGMAYVRGSGPTSYWECSAILKGQAIPAGLPGALKHEILSEQQPSANGRTTRPRV